MVMFTGTEVSQLRVLSNVSTSFLVDWSIYILNDLQSTLTMQELEAQYNSYLAAGSINVYNPVSIMSALEQDSIVNSWVSTGFLAAFVFDLQLIE